MKGLIMLSVFTLASAIAYGAWTLSQSGRYTLSTGRFNNAGKTYHLLLDSRTGQSWVLKHWEDEWRRVPRN